MNMKDDIDFLVSETFNECESMTGRNPFFEEEILPQAPGLIYRVEKGSSTFVIRLLDTVNIAEMMEEIKVTPSKFTSLRLKTEDGELPKLNTFETPNLELAQTIRNQIQNKRFPIHEESLCNLSDPGFSWWLSHNAHSLSISFKNFRVDDQSKYVPIGPMGDSKLTAMKLNQCQALIRELFPVSHFFCNENLFGLETSSLGLDNFDKFKRLFISGFALEDLFANQMRNEKFCEQHKNALTYLRELSYIRKFWKVIESEIKGLTQI